MIVNLGHRVFVVALYSDEKEHDTVLILTIRHQREAGYSHDS